ncbi:hypothetical protein [Pectobacterium parmentieri]
MTIGLTILAIGTSLPELAYGHRRNIEKRR